MQAYVAIVTAVFALRLIVGVREVREWPGETRPVPRQVLIMRAVLHLALAVWGVLLLVM